MGSYPRTLESISAFLSQPKMSGKPNAGVAAVTVGGLLFRQWSQVNVAPGIASYVLVI